MEQTTGGIFAALNQVLSKTAFDKEAAGVVMPGVDTEMFMASMEDLWKSKSKADYMECLVSGMHLRVASGAVQILDERDEWRSLTPKEWKVIGEHPIFGKKQSCQQGDALIYDN
jgi:hypothetical protein